MVKVNILKLSKTPCIDNIKKILKVSGYFGLLENNKDILVNEKGYKWLIDNGLRDYEKTVFTGTYHTPYGIFRLLHYLFPIGKKEDCGTIILIKDIDIVFRINIDTGEYIWMGGVNLLKIEDYFTFNND